MPRKHFEKHFVAKTILGQKDTVCTFLEVTGGKTGQLPENALTEILRENKKRTARELTENQQRTNREPSAVCAYKMAFYASSFTEKEECISTSFFRDGKGPEKPDLARRRPMVLCWFSVGSPLVLLVLRWAARGLHVRR